MDATWCGLCATYLGEPGPCSRCGAVTRLELSDAARAYVAERKRRLAEFDERWRAMTDAEREQMRREAEKGAIDNDRK